MAEQLLELPEMKAFAKLGTARPDGEYLAYAVGILETALAAAGGF
jgi:hypothetical protein